MICSKWAKTCKCSGMVLFRNNAPCSFHYAMIERAGEEEDRESERVKG